ncbi:MAG: hypothetical protein B6U78_00520 [Candidatus Aenigmarchaeota archaeon ex4484_224]|nr:MAG: hypothetical protein B6U78_00520 [Candidatus Aenigmarchaeota archaeon ex4484_224]
MSRKSYWFSSSPRIIVAPSKYSNYLRSSKLEKLYDLLSTYEINSIIIYEPFLTVLRSHPKNRFPSYSISDPHHPSQLLTKILRDNLPNEARILILVPGYPGYGGVLPLNGKVESLLEKSEYDHVGIKKKNEIKYGGFSEDLFSKLYDDRKYKLGIIYKLLEKKGYSEEAIEDLIKFFEKIQKVNRPKEEILEDERKIGKENRKKFKSNFASLLSLISELYRNREIKVFLLLRKISQIAKMIGQVLKRKEIVELPNIRIYSKPITGPVDLYSYCSQSLTYILSNLGVEKKITRDDIINYFPKIDIPFNSRLYFDEESFSYKIVDYDELIRKVSSKNSLDVYFGKLVTDRERFWKEYLPFVYNIYYKKEYGKNFEELNENEIKEILEKAIEDFNIHPTIDIESLCIVQWDKIGLLMPFTSLIQIQYPKENELLRFRASYHSNPFKIARIVSYLLDMISIADKEFNREMIWRKITTEKERIYIQSGNLFHDLTIHEPNYYPNEIYVNHFIWKEMGISRNPIPRKAFTEREIASYVNVKGKEVYFSARVDFLLKYENEELLVVGDAKYSFVYPELYKLKDRNQLIHEKIILENLGYPVAENGILDYGIFASTRTKTRPTQRYPSLRFEEDVYRNVINLFNEIGEILEIYFDSSNEKFYDQLENWAENLDKTLDWNKKLRYIEAIAELVPYFVKLYRIKEEDAGRFYFN